MYSYVLGKVTSLTTIISINFCAVAFFIVFCSCSNAATYYVCGNGTTCGSGWSAGSDSNAGTSKSAPCQTIPGGIGKMNSGDTLIVGNGTYTQGIKLSYMSNLNGTSGTYTTIKAENDWGVLIDGTGWANTFIDGIEIYNQSYIQVQGFRIKTAQSATNNGPVAVEFSNHIKVIKVAALLSATSGDSSSFGTGGDSYVLFEDCYAFGGSRYQFLAYQSDHVVFRRCVARNDYWNSSLQCAGFVNYDSVYTSWQNVVALDSDTANCQGGSGLYGGFYGENKINTGGDTNGGDTTQTFDGDIFLNIVPDTYYAGAVADQKISGTHTFNNVVLWNSPSGFYIDYLLGVTPYLYMNNITVGNTTGNFAVEGPGGTGISLYSNLTNAVQNSIFYGNHSLGISDYVNSDYNDFYNNGKNAGGVHQTPSIGSHSITSNPMTNGLLYLPRIESGSTLKAAGNGGGQIGAQIIYKMGNSGTLYGEPGWNTLTSDSLWPWPNEAQIKNDMAAYSGPGGVGTRGFCSGVSKDGSPQTLTKYIWEYLGNQIPADIYSGVSIPKRLGIVSVSQ